MPRKTNNTSIFDNEDQGLEYSKVFNRSKRYAMIDLHGLSPQEAEKTVNHWLSVSGRIGYDHFRFVTGRGNHVNSKGKRGTLYKEFLSWLERSPSKDRINNCQQHDGYFEVAIKPTKLSAPVSNFFQQTVDKYIKHNIREIKDCAEKGDPGYQMLYAALLEEGECVEQNFKEAVKFYELAADKNHAPAMHELARCYLHGRGVKQSDKEAVKYLEKADKLDLVDSTISLGDCYWCGYGVAQDPRVAVSYYSKAAARHNDPVAMRKLASAYNQGIGIKKSEIEAFKWYKKSADAGDVLAQYNVGVFYESGSGTEQNLEAAFKYYKCSAEGGDIDGQFFTGQAYWLGKGVEKNEELALFWLRTAANNGSIHASHLLSYISNKEDQLKHLEKSAESGYLQDWMRLIQVKNKGLTEGEFYAEHDKKIQQAFDLPIQDINSLDDYSKFMILDSMLADGSRKYKYKALSILQQLGNESCIFSFRRLAEIYKRGSKELKVTKSLDKSIKFTLKACELNDSKSCVVMGNYHVHGYGVELSQVAAAGYYEKAAKLNNPSGYFYLAIIRLQNFNNVNDILTAYKFLQTAIDLEKDKKCIDELESGFIDLYDPITEKAADLLHGMLPYVNLMLPTQIYNSNENDEIEPEPEADEPEINNENESQDYYCLIL